MNTRNILAVIFGVLFAATPAFAITVFNSAQLGASPGAGLYLQSNGTTNTWVAITPTGGSAQVGTSTNETAGFLSYWTTTSGTPALLGKVATGTVSAGSSAITVTAGRSVVGGALSIDCATASGGQNGCLSSADYTTFSGKESALTFTAPIFRAGNTISWFGFSTSSPLTGGQLLYSDGKNIISNVATGTISAGSSAITVTAGRSAVGGALAIDCATSGSGQNGCLSSTDWTTFNNKQAPGFQIGTTSGLAMSNLAYFSTVTGTVLGGVATGTISAGSTAITVTAGRSAIGGALSINCATASGSQNGCLSSTAFTLFSTGLWPFTRNLASVFYAQASQSTTTEIHFGGSPYSLTASSTSAFNKIETGSSTPTTFAGAPLVLIGNSANYVQGVIQNRATGANASGLLAIHGDLGTDSTYFTELGINNSGYSQSTFSSQNQLDSFLNASDGALVLSTASSTNYTAGIRFATGGTASSSIRMMIGQGGHIVIGTSTQPSLAALTIATSTAPQLSLGSWLGSIGQWVMRVLGNGDFAMATTTATGTATTTTVAFGISANGQVSSGASSVATSTTMQIDWRGTPNQVEAKIGFAATTIAIINATTSQNWGSRKIVWVCNPGGTAGAITWSGVEWVGSAPTQTTSANQCDVYSFDITSATSTNASPTYKVAGTAGAGFQ